MNTVTQPPSSVESEQAVLGALLMDNRAFDRIDGLEPEHFFSSANRTIYAALQSELRAGKAADPVTLHQTVGREVEDIGGLAYLLSLTNAVTGASAIRRHAEIIRDRYQARQLLSVSWEIGALAMDNATPIADRIDRAQAEISKLAKDAPQDEWVSAYEGMVQHTEVLERRHAGEITAWPTGLTDLDDYLEGGLRPGELVIVGARPSMGKTALGLTIGVHMAREKAVAVLSMEMSHGEVRDRLTAMLGNVSLSAVKRPASGPGLQWDRVSEGVDKAKHLRLHVNTHGALNIDQVRAKARGIKRLHGLDVLVVDYIGLMTGLNPKDNRNTQLGEVSRGLKALAKELSICVLCLAQLNRGAEDRPDAMPAMRDLRDSGEIEQDADVILFIKRPIMANPDLGSEWTYYAKLSVAKNRQGRCGFLDLSYIGDQTRFSGWSGPAPTKQTTTERRPSRGMHED